MNILAHRGDWWKYSHEKNSLMSLMSAIELGLGVETDVRDCNGILGISHDPPNKEKLLLLDDFFEAYVQKSGQSCLALNIKSDGLHDLLLSKIQKYQIKNYFVFDMSIPDTLGYKKLEIPFAVRMSEYETGDELLEYAEYIWLDAFEHEWYSSDKIRDLLNMGKKVVVVSPELHKRDHSELWQALLPLVANDGLYLCTDFVSDAMEFFDVNKN